MRIVKLDILEDAILQGVDEIAFVESPAIEEDYYAFSKQAFATYTDYPQAASDNAARAVKWATENGWGGCGTPVGKARAHQLANRRPISEETIARMAAFERHRRNSDTPYGRGCGGLMWDAWGGSEGVEWAQRKLQNIREEEMALEVAGLPAYANELLGTNIPKTESFQTEEELAQNIDVFGYKTKYIFVCPGAIGTFEHLKTMNPDDETIGMIRSAAVLADAVFKIEYDVLQAKEATPEQLSEAIILVNDFKDVMHEIDEEVGMIHDVSYMDGHIETIKSYTPAYIEEAFAKLIYEDLKALGAEGISEVESKELFNALEDQQMIISPLMIPNKLIPRIDEATGEEYYVYFTADTIKKISYKFMSEKLLDKFNIEHDGEMPVQGAVIVESWLVNDPLTDKAKIYGFSVPPGAWIAMIKVNNKKFWKEFIKSGKTKGLSVEGYFSDKIMSYAKQEFINPLAGESEADYVSRCIPVMKGEGYADDQAAAICYSKYQNR
jgi:hypothetical protein